MFANLKNDDESDSATVMELILSASGLANADTFSKSDPFCVVEEVFSADKCVEIERTEAIQNCLNPHWGTKIRLTVEHSQTERQLQQREFRFSIYDSDSDASALTFHDFLGRCQCRLSDIFSSQNNSIVLRLKKDRDVITKGQLIVHAEQFNPSRETTVSFECRGLLSSPHKRWALKPNIAIKAPSSYLEFFRMSADDRTGLLMVHRTEIIVNTWNPEWNIFEIPLRLLCPGNRDRPFMIRCLAHDIFGNDQLVGVVETSLNALIVGRQWRVELVNEQKRMKKHDIYKTEGHLHFIHVKVNKMDS